MNHSGRPSSVTLWHLPAVVALTIVILSFFPSIRQNYLQTERHSLRCQKILWFTGVAAREKHDASDLLKVALLSAKKRAPSLVPVLIYDGPNEHPLPQWFSNRGGFVVHHNSSLIPFFEELPKNISSNLIKHQGAYLRLEIPVVMNRILAGQTTVDYSIADMTHVLYTDTDVMFRKDINSCNLPRPRILSLGPQAVQNEKRNTGVMAINVSAFREELPGVIDLGRAEQWQFTSFDQGLILEYFQRTDFSKVDPLPDIFNYKLYWKYDPAAIIIHTHGPKLLGVGRNCTLCFVSNLTDSSLEDCTGVCPKDYLPLFKLAWENNRGVMYAIALEKADNYLTADKLVRQ